MTEKNEERRQPSTEGDPPDDDPKRDERDEDEVDKAVEETFPASDPPAW